MAGWRGSWRRSAVAAFMGALVAALLLSITGAAAEEVSSVLVGFRGVPDVRAVEGLGARVAHVYNLVPAIAVEVPDSKIAAIRRLAAVAYVEPDYPIYATGSSRLSLTLEPLRVGDADALFDPAAEVLPWGIARIGAPDVWLGVFAPPNLGEGIRVAIIDTGIDYFHPDLADNYVLGYDFANNDWDPLDDHGHGTHVAGTIAALDDGPNYGGANTTGVSVVGVGPQVSLYIGKALDRNGTGRTSDLVAALDAAARYGIDVVNMSLGSLFSSATLKSACAAANSAGVLLVAAAGNEGAPWLDVPARYSSVVSVGATNVLDQHAGFSNTSANLELSAPGVDVLSTMPTYPVALNQWPYGYQQDYDYLSGTSMACPHVVGAAALVMAAHPDWSNLQVRQRLAATAVDLGAAGRDRYFGYGLVDAAAAAQ